MLAEHLGAEVGEVVLNLAFAGVAVLLHEFLCGGAVLPLVVGYFIAADVDVGRAGEKFADFCQHIFDELEGEVIGRHDMREYAPSGDYLGGKIRAILVAKLGVGGDCGAGVAGNFDFGDDGDAEAVGIFHHFADVFLAVVEFDRLAIFLLLVNPAGTFLAFAANFGESGVFFNLDAPALVIGEVPVQAVELVARH